jgi:hypothetical protein
VIAGALAVAGVLLVGGAHGPDGGGAAPRDRVIELTVPRQPAAGEAASLRVAAGVLPQGSRVLVRLADGELLGTIAPFGIRPGEKAGAYTIPLPERAVRGGTVTLHLTLELPDGASRSPTEKEIEGAELRFQ